MEIRLGTHRAYVACHPALVRRVHADDHTFDKSGPSFERGPVRLDTLIHPRHLRLRLERRLPHPG